MPEVRYDAKVAARLARQALACVTREFPCNPAHVMRGAKEARGPRELHPSFYGCFDWHSAVHAHWLLAHLLRSFPSLGEARAIRAVLDRHLSRKSLRVEAAYLRTHPGFERPYGWSWTLKLALELEGTPWAANLRPLAAVVESLYLAWLPKQTYPIRAGTHANTAFGLGFALDYARGFRRTALERLILKSSKAFYAGDEHYPAGWEPGGNDFLSPCLAEADLMRRVLAPKAFSAWFRRFLPEIPPTLLRPAKASDRSDGQLAHLDGLNLSRAWCFFNLSGERRALRQAGKRHLEAGLRHVASGDYAGEHWLASFAGYALASAALASAAADSARAAPRRG